MDEDLKNLLEKNLEVSEKSLTILKKMYRGIVWSRFFHLAKWALVIGLLIFVFIKIQPYVVYWAGVFNSISDNIEKLNNIFR